MTTSQTPIIRAEHVSFTYSEDKKNGKYAVNDLSLSIERGSFVALIGHNGSGKSTVAKLLCGVLEPTLGEVRVDSRTAGRVLSSSSEDDLYDLRRTVGMVFQNPDNQLVATVVEEDVAFAPENMGVPTKEIRERVDDALRTVGLYDYRLHDTHKLSGGQKQRVAIAGILAMSPECIIFDESTAMLDPKGRQDVLDVIARLRDERGITVILITHYMTEAALADRVIVTEEGKVLLDGTPREIFAQKDALKATGLEVPPAAELVRRLHDDGADIRKTALSADEAAELILKAFRE